MRLFIIILFFTAQLAGAAPPAEPSAAAGKLALLLKAKRYIDFERTLNEAPDLAAQDRSFFSGVLANRKNQTTESLRLLEPLLLQPQVASLTAEQSKQGWLTLADDYVKSFQYGKAAEAFAHVLQQSASLLAEQEKKDIADSRHTFELMKDYPAQTIEPGGAFTVPTKRNALGLIEIPIEAGGQTGLAIIDTGADLTTLSLSRAHQLGLKISEGTIPASGAAGGVVQCHVALIPRLQIGKAEIHNVAAIVMDDKDLYVDQVHFQIGTVIGYPVIAALGQVTFYADGRLGAGPSTNNKGAEMFMEELKPLVAAKTAKGLRLFTLDTGGNNTLLYDLYWNENRDAYAGVNPGPIQVAGTGGSREVPACNAAEVPLTFGTVPVVLHNIATLTKPHADAAEVFYGNLGQDFLRPFRSYSLDFRSMRFEIDTGANH